MNKSSSSSSLSFKLLLAAVLALFALLSSRRIATLHALSFVSSNRRQMPTTSRAISTTQWPKDKNNNNNKMVARPFESQATRPAPFVAEREDSASLHHQQRQHHSSSDHHHLLSPIHHITSATAAAAATIETTTTTTTSSSASLSDWETWCVQNMHSMYRQALSMKCPFFRRRASDLLDALDQVMRFLIICRHKSLVPLDLAPPPSWRLISLSSSNDNETGSSSMAAISSAAAPTKNNNNNNKKLTHLNMSQRMEMIRRDWRVDTNKGYYITARLNTSLYRDDCVFDGPDPDMPVRGLHKYMNAASQLFEVKSSCAQLLKLQEEEEELSSIPNDNDSTPTTTAVIVAHWKIHGTLRLPWKPQLPTWTGSTTYHFDDDGLIYKHVETWDNMSVAQAFLQTLAPNLARVFWKEEEEASLRT